jgi:hypothetical protein
MQEGVVFLYTLSPQTLNDQLANIKAFCVSPDGLPVWDGGFCHIATTITPKLHYDSDKSGLMWGVVTWEDGSGPSNTYAMRFNYNGTLGEIIPTPYNLTAEVIGDNSIQLTWQFPDVMIMPIAFRIYRNAVLIQEVTAGTFTYTDPELGPGLWSYYVTAVFESGDESPHSNEVTINMTGNNDSETTPPMFGIAAFPNPFTSAVNLAVKGIRAADNTTVSIYNVKGQMVRQVSFTGQLEITWNWDGKDSSSKPVSPGIYFARVSSGAERASAKLMKF